MEAQDHAECDEKMGGLDDSQTNDFLLTDGRCHSAFDSSSALPTDFNPSSLGVKSLSMNGELAEALTCSGSFEVLLGASTTQNDHYVSLLPHLRPFLGQNQNRRFKDPGVYQFFVTFHHR
ncbi:hypothetical protein BLNAU_8050 [Blattamonas nauphoetae]|uniref:Uncharacterized protein n=1 Tax=Blattamonas nauphoetae TaxID=2049346 RepID=A0ABQ9XZQ2_9EUKA|nr:hypothetical protein BLNAU_8050 [Blattamonas nauphoetae]